MEGERRDDDKEEKQQEERGKETPEIRLKKNTGLEKGKQFCGEAGCETNRGKKEIKKEKEQQKQVERP